MKSQSASVVTLEAPLSAMGTAVMPGIAYRIADVPEAGLMGGRRVIVVGIDPTRGRALYVEDTEAADLIDMAPASLLEPCFG